MNSTSNILPCTVTDKSLHCICFNMDDVKNQTPFPLLGNIPIQTENTGRVRKAKPHRGHEGGSNRTKETCYRPIQIARWLRQMVR